jgi:hypothetical protein
MPNQCKWTHCSEGHALEGNNLAPVGRGKFRCRKCKVLNGTKDRQKNKEKVLCKCGNSLDGEFQCCIKCRRRALKGYHKKRGNPDSDGNPTSSFTRRGHKSQRERNLFNKYGLTEDQVQTMLEDQGNCCALCSKAMIKYRIDHNHITKKVRGILCHRCNLVIGGGWDDPDFCSKALAYLKRGLF